MTKVLLVAFALSMLAVACGDMDLSDPDGATSLASQEQAAGQFCGGIAGIDCPRNLVCVDDPSDDCDPNNGGADCGGMCVARRCGGGPGIHYVSRDPDACAAIHFFCDDGLQPFFNRCGCGCEAIR